MKNSGSFVSQARQINATAAAAVIALLIFLSIIPLASADVWFEAVILAVVFVLSAISVWFGYLELENRRLLVPLLVLAIYSFIQGVATAFLQTESAFLPQSFDLAASLWSALKIFAFALLLGLLMVNFRRRVKFLTWALIITGNFFAAFGILRFLFQTSFPALFASFLSPQLAPGIGFGTFFNQNHYATLMLMTFGLCMGLLRFGKQPMMAKVFLLLGSLTTWTATVLTASRGGIVGSFAVIAVLFLLPVLITIAGRKSNRKRETSPSKFAPIARQIASLLLVFGFLVIGVYLIGQDRIVGRFEELSGQIDGVTNAATFRRTDVWLAAISIIKDFPLFGIGFGGFHVAVSQYIDISGQLVPKQAHNDYLEFAASGGLVAIALAVWFLIRFFSLLRQRFAEPSDSFSLAARVGAICGLSGVALHSFFDFSLQIFANLLFFAALLFLSIHQTPEKSAPAENSPSTKAFFNFPFSILCLLLAFPTVFFGFARYQLELAKAAPRLEFIENDLYQIPWDANFHETKAAVYENLGDTEAALKELKSAIKYRSRDYGLWLKSGKLEQSQNRLSEAENAFRRAVQLAPLYGEPHFFYGNFLVNTNRHADGFAEIRYASRRNPKYFTEALELVWRETGGDAAETIRILSPLDSLEIERFALFLFYKENYAGLVRLGCGTEAVTDEQRDWLIKMLFEKNRYSFAHLIYRRECSASAGGGTLEDGNFENGAVSEGTGFGWRVQMSDNTRLSLDKGVSNEGQSLRFDFKGQEDSFALLSQIVPVEKNGRYRLSFSYRTSEIVTGGVPMIQVVLKQPGGEITVREEKLSLEENAGWIRMTIEFETGGRTEAIELRLTRQSCAQSLCPIFGELWLDDFRLQKND